MRNVVKWSSILWLLAVPCLAHEPGLSSAVLKVLPNGIEATLTFSVADVENILTMDNDLDGKVSQLEFAYAKTRLAALATEALVVSLNGSNVITGEPSLLLDEKNNVDMQLFYPGATSGTLKVQAKALASLPKGHRQFVTVERADKRIAERLLSSDNDSLEVSLSAAMTSGEPTEPVPSSFFEFFVLGIKHILTGYDHLLFLFGLLIVSTRFLDSLKIITFFTLAHSITLAVATFNLIEIPSRIVEPAIAASIVYVGAENLWSGGKAPKGRWLLTFAFGLIHGFGFASVLREMGIASGHGGILIPLVSFNLGVETGQIMVAAVALPLFWWMRTHKAFVQRGVPACSILIALAGAYWLVQRVVG
ncbi:MAG: HupE/UreJ family protein [Verrucomicrobiales bacterium]|nr:HupE/UreJ family protein [Verrucomicrobiales bacterium]